MLEAIMSRLGHMDKVNKWMERFEDEHPLLGILLFQVSVGILLIASVSGIAFAGGGIIWMFYKIMGMM